VSHGRPTPPTLSKPAATSGFLAVSLRGLKDESEIDRDTCSLKSGRHLCRPKYRSRGDWLSVLANVNVKRVVDILYIDDWIYSGLVLARLSLASQIQGSTG
jgi:hypothetical protein